MAGSSRPHWPRAARAGAASWILRRSACAEGGTGSSRPSRRGRVQASVKRPVGSAGRGVLGVLPAADGGSRLTWRGGPGRIPYYSYTAGGTSLVVTLLSNPPRPQRRPTRSTKLEGPRPWVHGHDRTLLAHPRTPSDPGDGCLMCPSRSSLSNICPPAAHTAHRTQHSSTSRAPAHPNPLCLDLALDQSCDKRSDGQSDGEKAGPTPHAPHEACDPPLRT